MNELIIRDIENAACHECNNTKPGVRFCFGRWGLGKTAFHCWEHFRLLQEAMKPGRVEHVAEMVSCGSCRHCGCWHRLHTTRCKTRFVRMTQCISNSEGRSHSTSQGETK